MNTVRVKAARFIQEKNPLDAAADWYASQIGCDAADVDAEWENTTKTHILVTVFDFDPDSEEDGTSGVLYY